MTARLLLLLLTCFCGTSIATQDPAFSTGSVEIEFNPAKCTVRFSLGALLHTVHGTFKVQDATARFDPASGQASGQVTVDVRSGETGERARDRQMQADVLESDRFPDAVFSLDRVKGRLSPSGDSQVEVQGSLRIHGGNHQMTLPVKVNVQNNLLTATAKFSIPYVAWGMKDPSNLMLRVDKTVDVEIALTGTVAAR
jgi:polyisoprenoid-binding protein YceI